MKNLIPIFVFLLTVSAVSAATADSVQKSINVDGDVSDWEGVGSYSITEPSPSMSPPSSSADLSGSFKTAWDDQYAYFLVEVTDDEIDVDGGSNIWEHDEVEIMLDGGNEKSTSYDSNDYKIMIQPDGLEVIWDGDWKVQDSNIAADDVIVSASQTSDSYVLEVGIKWNFIGGNPPSDNVVYGFDIGVNDRDNEAIEHYLAWRYANNHARDTSGWHSLQLSGSGSSTSSSYSFNPSNLDFTSSSSQNLELSISDTVVYNTGYYSTDGGSDWKQFSLTSTSNSGNWLLSSASSTISLSLNEVNNSGKELVAFYACTWSSGWNCHGNNWQIKEFQVTLPESDNESTCNNGVIETGEECDGTDLSGESCTSQGYDGGTLSCTSSCTFDTSACTQGAVCGDGVIEGNEECEGADLGGATCTTLGYDTGTLSCDSSCQYDTSSCESSDLPTVNAHAPKDITVNSANLIGEMTRYGIDGQADVNFQWRERGTTSWTSTPVQTVNDPHAFTHTVSTLKNSTLYEYRVFAQNSAGNTTSAVQLFTTTYPAVGGSIEGDYQALQDLYTSTDGDNWYDNTGWPSMTPETMGEATGITTNAEGRVVEIDMQSQHMEGESKLGNDLNGQLPESIGNLNQVTHLRLKTNSLTGPIPESIGNMTSLRWLALAGQRCDVDLADHQWNENNHRMCPGENSKAWQETNSFTGPIPESIGNLRNLEMLEIRRQYLTGTIPSSIGNLVNLKGIFLNDQKGNDPLGGALPPEMGNLVNLKHLHLDSRSNDNGGFTEFPEEINQGLKEIRHIRLRDNQFTGNMPDLPNAYDLYIYIMSHNNFTGDFPIGIFQGEHPSLNNFGIASNPLSGEIPTNFIPPPRRTNYHSMSKFGIGNTDFTGEIPDWIQDMRGHQVWDANGANFNGEFPDKVLDAPQLKVLMFCGNNLSGPLPNKEWATERMLTLYACSNNFTGPIPPEWQTLVNSKNRLWIIYLMDNELSGEIPAWWADITGLERLRLHNNKFTPKDILPHRDAIAATVDGYIYTPQKPFGRVETVSVGTTIDRSSFDYTGNNYQWYKDGSALSGETTPTINTNTHGTGTYTLEITHPDIDYTFTSEPITAE